MFEISRLIKWAHLWMDASHVVLTLLTSRTRRSCSSPWGYYFASHWPSTLFHLIDPTLVINSLNSANVVRNSFWYVEAYVYMTQKKHFIMSKNSEQKFSLSILIFYRKMSANFVFLHTIKKYRFFRETISWAHRISRCTYKFFLSKILTTA